MDISLSYQELNSLFQSNMSSRNLNGAIGVASFRAVYDALMPIQKTKLEQRTEDRVNDYMSHGSFITIAYVYPKEAIKSIAVETPDGYDKTLWNYYAEWYHRLNMALNETAEIIAQETGGISIPATTSGVAPKVSHVEDYYPLVVSHRVGAELSGVGWRGKNELIVNPEHSCAIRLASIFTPYRIEPTKPLKQDCGECQACQNACPFLKHKDKLDNYREQCRRYINSLELDDEVCGKCIKACVYGSIYADKFSLST